MDSGQLARSGSLRLHAAGDSADLSPGTVALERAGHLSFCRCLRRDGAPLARDDSRLRRSRIIRAFQVALHSCTSVFGAGMRDVFLLGPQRHCAGRLCLGRLARHDANVWVLSHLRCESGLVRGADAPSRFRIVRDLVRHRGPSLTTAND